MKRFNAEQVQKSYKLNDVFVGFPTSVVLGGGQFRACTRL